MAGKLPFFHDQPAHRYTVALEGAQYEIRLVYRARTASWYLDLADADGVWLLRGRRLAPSAAVNHGLITSGPPGVLVPVGADPYPQDEIELWYLTAAEVEAAASVVAPLPLVRT